MSRIVLLLLGLALILGTISAERVRFDNYQVYQVIPSSASQVELLTQLEQSSDSLIFLQAVTKPGADFHVVVAPHKQPDFLQILNQNVITYSLIENNLQNELDVEIFDSLKRASNVYDWKSFHKLDETYNWIRSLGEKYPEVLEVVVAGETFEGRDILGVKLSYGPDRKGIFIEGGMHAREWISPATVTYILNEFLTSTDPEIRELAESYDWYIVPHANPDGYVYTHTTNRLWRKTRSRNGLCYGADPNRNWGFHWMEIGASSFPCSDTFAGTAAFSEIETRTFSNYIESVSEDLRTYISFHSYSQLLLFPYGHTNEHAENHDDLQQIGDAAANALSRRYGTKYVVGNIYDAIYPASGASIDWAFGTLDVPVTYTYELRPSSTSFNGFVLPASEIIPTCEETMDSLIALVKEANSLGYYD